MILFLFLSRFLVHSSYTRRSHTRTHTLTHTRVRTHTHTHSHTRICCIKGKCVSVLLLLHIRVHTTDKRSHLGLARVHVNNIIRRPSFSCCALAISTSPGHRRVRRSCCPLGIIVVCISPVAVFLGASRPPSFPGRALVGTRYNIIALLPKTNWKQ